MRSATNKNRYVPLAVLMLLSILLGWNFINKYWHISNDAESIVIASPSGKRLIIYIQKCHRPERTDDLVSSSGNWEMKNNSVVYNCKNQLAGRLHVQGVGHNARSEYLIKDPLLKRLPREGRFDLYQLELKGVVSSGVVTFIADDGYRVYLSYLPEMPGTYTVYRRLDDDFEISYVIHGQDGSRIDMVENDKKILAYVKSISSVIK